MADKPIEPEPEDELLQFLIDQQAQQPTTAQSDKNILARLFKRK